jgi:hypothetical protein
MERLTLRRSMVNVCATPKERFEVRKELNYRDEPVTIATLPFNVITGGTGTTLLVASGAEFVAAIRSISPYFQS